MPVAFITSAVPSLGSASSLSSRYSPFHISHTTPQQHYPLSLSHPHPHPRHLHLHPPSPAPLPNIHNNSITMSSEVPRPSTKPASPCFSSGPCKKRPGYDLAVALADAPLGRSHRSKLGAAKIAEAIQLTKEVLEIPSDYRVAIVPASDTGAVEMALWSMCGPVPIDVCYWEAFGKGWWEDINSSLKLKETREFMGHYGQLPSGLVEGTAVDPINHDVIFTWNGTTSGVKIPHADWIPDDRSAGTGLTICDATSAVFAMDIPWTKIDVLTYSWQKVLGGEAAHGMLILSPRAVQRLESYTPDRPLPKIFKMTKGGKINEELFQGSVINTVSMMCVEDYLDALKWSKSIGGLSALVQRSEDNLQVLEDFVSANPWIQFLAKDKSYRSNTSVCLTLDLPKEKVKDLISLIEKEGVAYDIGAYRDAPPGLRIWCGATVEKDDVLALTHWLNWAYHQVK